MVLKLLYFVEQLDMTKEQRTLKRKYKLQQIAIQVCDEVLGPIERDQTTLDALEVARVMTDSPSSTTSTSTWMPSSKRSPSIRWRTFHTLRTKGRSPRKNRMSMFGKRGKSPGMR